MLISKMRRRFFLGAAAIGALQFQRGAAQGPVHLPPPSLAVRTLRVGPEREIKTLSEASSLARDGDTVLVDAGDYRGDVAIWNQNGIVIKGEGGHAVLRADGASAEGKGIFVVRGRDVRIRNLAFMGARVRDRNGAGIRLEGSGHLTVERCRFEDNENGILTSNEVASELHIIDSEFTANGAGDGQSHNLYVGGIGKLTVIGSYFARAHVGHLLKSRARESVVSYSRLSGEDGTSSYELEFPSGGKATVIGCVVQQGPRTENSTIVSFGAEGYKWDHNGLFVSFCTLVNDRPGGGLFLKAARGTASIYLANNLIVGPGTFDLNGTNASIHNVEAAPKDFADARRLDLRLRRTARQVGSLGMAGAFAPGEVLPDREYVFPAGSQTIEHLSSLTPISPGAFQRVA